MILKTTNGGALLQWKVIQFNAKEIQLIQTTPTFNPSKK